MPFGEIAKNTVKKGRSCLYYDRLYTIYQSLTNVVRIKGFKYLNTVEVGVYKGGTSYFIGTTLDMLKVDWHHFCFDTFEGHHAKDVLDKDPYQKPQQFKDTTFEDVKVLLRPFKKIKIFKGRFQDKCNEISGKKFHFVHLDVDLYGPTLFGLEFFESRLVEGGIIVVDDYGYKSCPGVKKAVDEFIMGKNNFFVMHLITGQAMLIKNSVYK